MSALCREWTNVGRRLPGGVRKWGSDYTRKSLLRGSQISCEYTQRIPEFVVTLLSYRPTFVAAAREGNGHVLLFEPNPLHSAPLHTRSFGRVERPERAQA